MPSQSRNLVANPKNGECVEKGQEFVRDIFLCGVMLMNTGGSKSFPSELKFSLSMQKF